MVAFTLKFYVLTQVRWLCNIKLMIEVIWLWCLMVSLGIPKLYMIIPSCIGLSIYLDKICNPMEYPGTYYGAFKCQFLNYTNLIGFRVTQPFHVRARVTHIDKNNMLELCYNVSWEPSDVHNMLRLCFGLWILSLNILSFLTCLSMEDRISIFTRKLLIRDTLIRHCCKVYLGRYLVICPLLPPNSK